MNVPSYEDFFFLHNSMAIESFVWAVSYSSKGFFIENWFHEWICDTEIHIFNDVTILDFTVNNINEKYVNMKQ